MNLVFVSVPAMNRQHSNHHRAENEKGGGYF